MPASSPREVRDVRPFCASGGTGGLLAKRGMDFARRRVNFLTIKGRYAL
jgi:hypothetical protein